RVLLLDLRLQRMVRRVTDVSGVDIADPTILWKWAQRLSQTSLEAGVGRSKARRHHGGIADLSGEEVTVAQVRGIDLIDVINAGREPGRLLADPTDIQHPVRPELPLRPKIEGLGVAGQL